MSKSKNWVTAFSVCWCFLLSKAERLSCIVSQYGSLTTYTISDSHAPDVNDCDFLWINGSDFTIADNFSQIPPVKKRSMNSLTTSQCLEDISYKQHCTSKATGGMIDHTANCAVICTGKDFNHGEDGVSKIGIAVGAIVAVILLAVLVFLCYKYRDNICGTSTFSQCGGLYMNVKMQNIDPKLPDV